eukprot:jgi/Galph1/486/GphlegSOOS_G5231.1
MSIGNAYDFMLKPVPGDEVARTISANGEIAFKSITATGLIDGAARIQGTLPVATAALGRTLMCAILLSAGKKSDETVNVEFRGNGPLRTVMAIADGLGQVRGYVGDPKVDLPPNTKGKLDVSRAIGDGILSVTRNHYSWKQPYQGLVKIVSGELAEDVASYLYESEQINSAVGAGVFVSQDGSVSAAGGYLVQLLPGASEETCNKLERNLYAMKHSPTEMIRAGMNAVDIIEELAKGFEIQQIHLSKPIYRCPCSIDRVERTVALLPKSEIEDIISTVGKLEIKCEFCNRLYHLTLEEVEKIHRERT